MRCSGPHQKQVRSGVAELAEVLMDTAAFEEYIALNKWLFHMEEER